LNSAEKRQLYRELCAEVYIPLHAKDWWLDAVCGLDNWEVILVIDKGKITGALPYSVSKKLGFLTQIINPTLSIYNNIYVCLPDNPDIKPIKLQSLENIIVNELVAQIPKTAFFRQQINPNLTNALPFIWAGFQQYTKYSFRYPDLTNTDSIFKGIAYNLRHGMKKANQNISISTKDDFDTLFLLNSQSYSSKGVALPYSEEFLKRIYQTLKKHNACDLHLAQDNKSGKNVAALLTAYDEKVAYAIVAGTSREGMNQSSLNCLYWQSVESAAKRVQIYDFEGSMNPKIEHIYRNFGASRTPYHCFYHFKNRTYHAAAVAAGLI
jgi:hypothetical protein